MLNAAFEHCPLRSWPRPPSNPHLSRFRRCHCATINPERKGKRLNEGSDGWPDAQDNGLSA
jgi:hypothetical protein